MSKLGFIAPLSYQQKELWIAEQLKTKTNTYVISTSYKIEGDLHVSCLEKSINKVIQRHEILRANIKKKNGHPVLFIQDNRTISIELNDIRSNINWNDQDKIDEIIFLQEEKPINIVEDSLLRVTLFEITEKNFLMLVEIHHLICDGWSLNIFMNELFHFYNEQINDNKTLVSLPALKIQYPDYSTWKNKSINNSNFNDQIDYWKKRLHNVPGNIKLPEKHTNSFYQTNEGAVEFFEFPVELSRKIKKLSKEKEVSLFTMLFTGFGILLARYSQQEDLVVGTTIANRTRPEFENLIGFFVDFVALRINCEGTKTFTDLLFEIKKIILEGFSNSQLPFSKVIDELNLQKDSSLSSFFQLMFIFQNTPLVKSNINGLQITPYKNNNLTAKYDITVEMRESDNQIFGLFQYNTGLFEKKTIGKIINAYKELFESIVINDKILINNINCITKEEHRELNGSLNNTEVDLGNVPSLIDLFESVANEQGNKDAIVFENKILTYKELDDLSNRFSFFLNTKFHIGYDDRVAIKMKRSENIIIAILGILKLRAVYVSLDLNYPELVVNELIESSSVKTIIDDISFKEFYAQKNNFSSKKRNLRRNSNDSITLLNTTGSTGKSKGVIINNLNLYNRLYWMWDKFPFRQEEVCAVKTSFGFVDHLWELFGPLLKGIKVVIFDRNTILNIPQFITKLSDHRITRIVLVPSLLREILSYEDLCTEKLANLKEWTCSGEALDTILVEKFHKTFAASRLLNIYGSTEVTADATYYDTSKDKDLKVLKTIPIGKPIYNTKIFIVDPLGNLLPFGAIGEICISGLGVTNGYFDNKFLNESKFSKSSFSNGNFLYKTGDYGRWLINGDIEYLGRKDNQVKIMGNRIDLVEIKNHLIKLSDIEDAVVISKDVENGNKVLAAFLKGNKVLNVQKVRADLSTRVKNYMLPSVFIQLEKFPLMPNGKIDEKSLKRPEFINKNIPLTYQGPTNEIEEKLVGLWSEILEIPFNKIGLFDNFFELGGNSMKLLSLIAKINLDFDKNLTITDIFKYVNVKSQASFLTDQKNNQIMSDEEIETSRDLFINTINKFSH